MINATGFLPPQGFMDTLPDDFVRAARLRNGLSALFTSHGYAGIETPLIESHSLFQSGPSQMPESRQWKTYAPDGSILVIRPDNTTPAVRLACARLTNLPPPIRLHYIQTVLRYPSMSAQAASGVELRQAGVELLGETAPEADAEVIALAIEAIRSSGLESFQIDIGQVGFFKGLMDEAGLTDTDAERMRALVEAKNSLGITLALRDAPVSSEGERSRIASRLQTLPTLFGGIEALDEARRMSGHPRCRAALDNLDAVYSLLRERGLERYLSIDLGMVQSINYYTGIVFRGLTGHLGQPLLSGGRYDDLPAAMGRPMGAVGFAIELDQLLTALGRENPDPGGGRVSVVQSEADAPQVTLAVAKGRLALDTFARLEAAGIDCGEARNPGRRLIVDDPTGRIRFMLVKPCDVPTYVDHGVADAGVAGKDTLMEENRPLYELLDLDIGKCRLCVAGNGERHREALRAAAYRVATKYPNIAREFFARRGQPIEIIALGGSVELAPLVGLSDVILDIVESGGTLKANGLSVLEEICPVSARLVVNRVSLKTKTAAIRALVKALEVTQ
ncbi:MAG: ATP phosphoribosyltransferase regulatory subunit [Oscillospiraceae bacterium]|jgi:ATP phosphoribosyltransferase regulatory subunit|nr:ATP phosphoribosyltransferase regulatory subunit [Oscillospiraceae bacterium]